MGERVGERICKLKGEEERAREQERETEKN